MAQQAQKADIGGLGRVQRIGGMNEHSHWKRYVYYVRLNPKEKLVETGML